MCYFQIQKTFYFQIRKTCYRNSRPEVFLRKGILKICSKFTVEHPCRSVISINLLWNSCIFSEHLWTAASVATFKYKICTSFKYRKCATYKYDKYCFIWLYNKLSSIHSISHINEEHRCMNKMFHQIDRKWMVAPFTSFYGKIWVGFCLHTGKRFLRSFILKPR